VNTNPLLGAVGTLEVAKQDALPNVQITGGAATVVYNSVGRLSDTAPPVVPFSLTAANAQPNDGRCITLDLSGRPVTKKGVCP
jgi:hypothetical protein